jgi:5'-deoxynucleotidase
MVNQNHKKVKGKGMKYHFYAYMSRLKNIKRWSLMRNTRDENVQEHSHMVTVIAHALCIIRNKILGGNIDEREVLAYAVYHDANEVITGDLPTPIKYFSADIKSSYKQIERFAGESLSGMLPGEMAKEIAPFVLGDVSPETKKIVRAADKLTAYIKCIEEKKSGNLEFERAGASTLQTVKDLKMPEAEYFIEHFLSSFEMTLDELN